MLPVYLHHPQSVAHILTVFQILPNPHTCQLPLLNPISPFPTGRPFSATKTFLSYISYIRVIDP